jgi:hypothetical protein
MFARVITTKVKAGKLQELVQTYQERVVAALPSIKGARVSYLLVDDATNDATSFAIFDSREDLEADSTAFRERVAAFTDLIEGPPNVRVYEVKAST